MADEPNIATHRYYQKGKHKSLAMSMLTKSTILAAGIALIDGAAADYVAEVTALLAGTAGFALDPADATTVFTDSAGTIPVATPNVDSIGRINSKFGNTSYFWTATAPTQPLWTGVAANFDGTDDALFGTTFNALNNATGATFTFRIKQDAFAGVNRCIFSCSTSVNSAIRFRLQARSDGSLSVDMRRLDADAGQSFITATGLIVAGNAYTVQVTINYLTGAVEIFVGGVSVFTGTYTAVDGISGVQNSGSTRVRLGVNSTNTLNDYDDGLIGCMVLVLSVLNAAGRASCKGFVERNAI